MRIAYVCADGGIAVFGVYPGPIDTDMVRAFEMPKTSPLDVARAIDRINTLTTLGIRSVASSWAGLRTFSADRQPVLGMDPDVPGFCWMVGQGGTGITTAPAAGEVVAAAVCGEPLPHHLAELGLGFALLGPTRIRSAGPSPLAQ